MRLHLENTELNLQENSPLGLVNGKGAIIRCIHGTAWLTVEGEAGDIFLSAGQSHQLKSNGLALVEGVGQATVRLEAAECGVLAALLQRLSILFCPGFHATPCPKI